MQRSSEAEAAVNAAKAEAAASARGDAAASAGVPFLALSMAVAPQCARAHASGAVPLGAVFAPFARGAEAPPVARGRGRPQRCGACGAAESAYSHASLQAGRWVCVFCGSENAVEGGASTQTDAAALGNVVDFVRGQAAADSSARLPATVFVVDTSADPEDVANMRAAITEAIGAMPDDARIGIVSAGASVRVYDMAATVMASADVLSGRSSPSREAMRALLIGAAVPVAPLRECREAALTATAALRCDSSAGVRAGADKAARGRAFIPTSERDRCVVTGVEVALGIIDGTDVAQMRPQQIGANSAGLYQGSKPTSSGGHVVLITTGPVTLGPGALPRDASHPLFLSECRAAARHVAALGDAAARQGAVIDVIAAGGTPIDVQHCLPMTERSGGAMQLVEELAAPLASTLRAGLLRTRATRSHVQCEIRVSRPLVVSRIMGAVHASKSGGDGDGDGDGDGELATGGGKGEAVHVALRVADSSAGIGVLYRLDEDVTSDYVFVQCVAQYVEVSTGDIRTRVVTRRLRTTASASMVAKGLNAEVAGLLAAKRALLTADSSSDANETSTYAGASVGARAKVFTASGDVACDELADRLVAAAGEMGAACGAPGTLPPALVPLAMRFYHFARGTAAAGGAPHPDEVALARSRLRTSGLDTSCYIMPRCWMVVPGAETEELVDVLPTNLVLMSNACVVLDAGSHTVVWVGASVSPDENAGVIDRCNAFATTLVTGRFPAPTLLTGAICCAYHPRLHATYQRSLPWPRD